VQISAASTRLSLLAKKPETETLMMEGHDLDERSLDDSMKTLKVSNTSPQAATRDLGLGGHSSFCYERDALGNVCEREVSLRSSLCDVTLIDQDIDFSCNDHY